MDQVALTIASSLSGVAVGSSIAWIREGFTNRRKRERNARYLAIRVVCALDRYVTQCADVAADDGLSHGQRDKDGFLQPQVALPPLPIFSGDMEWSSIDASLMYGLLSLANEAETANRVISAASEFAASPPDFDEYFEARQDEYTKLGLRANELRDLLRRKYGIPPTKNGSWKPVESLMISKLELEEFREKRAKLIAEGPRLI